MFIVVNVAVSIAEEILQVAVKCVVKIITSLPTTLIILLYEFEDEFEHLPYIVETPMSSSDPSPRNMPINSNTTLTHHLKVPTTRQGVISAKIEQIVVQRVTNAIEAIAIYETKIRVAHDLIILVVRKEAKVAKNANNMKKWESDHGRNFSKQRNKKRKVVRAYTARPDKKNGYAGKTPVLATTQRPPVANHKTAVTCYECGKQGHYRRIMEMKPNIESMRINEYLVYEAAKKRQLWDNVRSRRSPTNYDEAYFDSFHQNKSNTFNYPFSHNLLPPHPCSLPVQPYPKNYLVSTNVSNDDSDFDEILDDLLDMIKFRIGVMMTHPEIGTMKARRIRRKMVMMGIFFICGILWSRTLNELDTKLILDELLEEFGDEIVNVTMDDEEATKDPQSHFTEIHVHSVITKPEPFIHTQSLNPLCGVFKASKPCKVDRDIITPGRYVVWKPLRDFIRPLGPPSGLKGLLYMLNETMIPTKSYSDDELLEKWMLLEEVDLEHVVSSSYRANPGESSILILLLSINFISFMYNRNIVQTKWGGWE
ncbi:hypothetical protein Tco_0478690 [Tanacetum coccineum]